MQPDTDNSSTLTHCPYCAFQCGMRLAGPPRETQVKADPVFPVNKGALCIKGWTSAETLHHPERLLTPFVRNHARELAPVSWDEALSRVVETFHLAQSSHGRDAVGVFGGGSLTNEKAYLLGKFARVALGTANIDYNGRFCMSSAAASIRAFGMDRGSPFPLEDIPQAQLVLLVEGNMAETMPPIMQYFEENRNNGGQLIMVAPRRSPSAEHVEQRLQALDILVVADFLLSETARLADVVLPTAQWAEEEGTMTNLKGRVIRRRAALAPAPGVSTDLDLICELAGRLGKGAHFAYTRPEGMFVELGRASAGRAADYSEISYRKIEKSHGGFWPCPSDVPGWVPHCQR